MAKQQLHSALQAAMAAQPSPATLSPQAPEHLPAPAARHRSRSRVSRTVQPTPLQSPPPMMLAQVFLREQATRWFRLRLLTRPPSAQPREATAKPQLHSALQAAMAAQPSPATLSPQAPEDLPALAARHRSRSLVLRTVQPTRLQSPPPMMLAQVFLREQATRWFRLRLLTLPPSEQPREATAKPQLHSALQAAMAAQPSPATLSPQAPEDLPAPAALPQSRLLVLPTAPRIRLQSPQRTPWAQGRPPLLQTA